MSKVAFLGLGAMGSRMAANLLLLEKDLGYTVETGGGEASMPAVSAVRSLFRRAIDENLGNLNMTAVAKLFSKER